MRIVYIISLCVALVSASYSADFEYIEFEPLPVNAEDIAREYLQDYFSNLFNGSNFCIGDSIVIYTSNSDINLVGYIVTFGGENELTFDHILDLYEGYYKANQICQNMLFGNESETYINNSKLQYYSDISHIYYKPLRDKVCVVVAFWDGDPAIITFGNLRFLNDYFKYGQDNIYGFGYVPNYGPRIRVIRNNDISEWNPRGCIDNNLHDRLFPVSSLSEQDLILIDYYNDVNFNDINNTTSNPNNIIDDGASNGTPPETIADIYDGKGIFV